MKLILFGTGPFAVPTFQSLLDSQHEVLALVTRPIADAGKRRKSAENPTRDLGVSRHLKIFDPVNANDPDFVNTLKSLHADLLVVCDYGQILSRPCLAAARWGGINLHGSLLPKYRGAAPIHWAIFHGETETGVTIIYMTAKLDGGPCLAVAALPIKPTDTTANLEPRLAELGVAPVHQAIAILEQWDGVRLIGKKQSPELASLAPRLQKSDGQIDWSRSAEKIVNQIRAFQPWPGTFLNWSTDRAKEPLRLLVHRATALPAAVDDSAVPVQPGAVAVCDKQQLLVQTGAGLLSIDEIQPAGKRPMTIEEFLRGHQPSVGTIFG